MKKSSLRQMRYDKVHIKQYSLKLHKVNDADLIKAIGEVNKQTKIKELMRKGLKKC